jgi:hypothetical protein
MKAMDKLTIDNYAKLYEIVRFHYLSFHFLSFYLSHIFSSFSCNKFLFVFSLPDFRLYEGIRKVAYLVTTI